MKVIISAVILAVAILLGSYFHAEATRYDIVSSGTNFYPNLIDRRTGRVWVIRGNDFNRGWQLIPTLEDQQDPIKKAFEPSPLREKE